MTPRLKAGIFVRALIRRAEVAGAAAYVVKKGTEESGAVVITVTNPGVSSMLLEQARRGNGEMVWVKPLGDAPDQDKIRAWLTKQQKFDPDLWVVEIEDKQARAFVDEPIV
jgi:hypothetical protein